MYRMLICLCFYVSIISLTRFVSCFIASLPLFLFLCLPLLHESISVSVSVFASTSFSLSACLPLSVSALFLSWSLSLSLFLFLNMLLYLFISLSLSLCLPLPISHSPSFHKCMNTGLSIALCTRACRFLSLYRDVPRSLRANSLRYGSAGVDVFIDT